MNAGKDLMQRADQLCARFVVGKAALHKSKSQINTGKDLTYKEHIERLRKYYLTHLPKGISREEIMAMSLNELEDMADI